MTVVKVHNIRTTEEGKDYKANINHVTDLVQHLSGERNWKTCNTNKSSLGQFPIYYICNIL